MLKRITQYAFYITAMLASASPFAAEVSEQGSFGLTSFAFANYLGTGFYTSSGQDVFVIQVPFEYQIRKMTDEQSGWLLNLPLTFGVVNIEDTDVGNLPEPGDVTTLSFLPGIEYQYPVTPDWSIRPFFDYGVARDFSYSNSIYITGTGIKSYYDMYESEKKKVSLSNKFIYAREQSENTGNSSDYTLIETGLNYRMTSDHVWGNNRIYANLYYIYFYYPDDLVFFERTTTPIRVGNEREAGFTLSNLPDMLFLENPEIGFGIRSGSGVTAYRIVFGAPF